MESGGRLYVPDTKKWTNFYTQISKGNVSPCIDHTMKRYQRGGGLRNNTSPFMVSIDKYARELNEREIRPKIKITSPSEQAKSEVVREKTKKRTPQFKPSSEKQTRREDQRPKKKKIVKFNSDVFGVY